VRLLLAGQLLASGVTYARSSRENGRQSDKPFNRVDFMILETTPLPTAESKEGPRRRLLQRPRQKAAI